MKKIYYLSMMGLLSLSALTGCKKDNPSDNNSSEEVSISTSEEETEYKEQGTYKLENGEVTPNVTVSTNPLKELTSTVAIEGIDTVFINPFLQVYFQGEATIRYPSQDALNGKVILYTSEWYLQNTATRDESVTEYVLLREDDIWYIDSISNSSSTFIPFNGAVLSIPTSSKTSYSVGDLVNITSSIPVYEVGFYNQKGYRIAVNEANIDSWNKSQIQLFDSNATSLVTNTEFSSTVMMNFVYDEKANTYTVDKCRMNSNNSRMYLNVNNGFVLATSLNSNANATTLINGARFSIGDSIQVEKNAAIHESFNTYSLSSANKYTLPDGTVKNFNLTKSTNSFTYNTWGYEIAIDSKGIVVSYDAKVDIPEGGYKLQLTTSGSTNSEDISYLIDIICPLGSKVTSTSTSVSINQSTLIRAPYLYSVVSSYYEDTMNDLATYNYSYNYTRLEEIGKELEKDNEEMSKLKSSIDPTNQYRYYSLMGHIFQLYQDIINSTCKNEAVENKTLWYITSFSGNDKSLDSLINHLKLIKNSGFNEIMLDIIDNGTSYYSNSQYFTINSSASKITFGDYADYAKAVIGEAHKLGIKVMANVTPFNDKIEKAFPELSDDAALSITGKTSVTSSQGKVEMLDPSSSDVQNAIKSTIQDIIECNPGIDGIHLDYIRYGADNNSVSTVMGVTESARVAFNEYCKENGLSYSYSTLDEFRNALKTSNTVFNYFNLYEQTAVTNTVANVKSVCLTKDLPLSCAIADYYSLVKSWKCQDWAEWAKQGYVDALYLMDYYFGEYTVAYYFKDMVEVTNNSCALIGAVDPSYANLSRDFYPRVIRGSKNHNASSGYAVFGTHTNDAKKDAWDLCSNTSWLDSITIYDELSKTMKASGDMLLQRCDDLYIKYNNQTEAQKAELSEDLNALYALIDGENYASAVNAATKIAEMKNKTYASGQAQNRIIEQLDNMLKIVNTKKNIFKD